MLNPLQSRTRLTPVAFVQTLVNCYYTRLRPSLSRARARVTWEQQVPLTQQAPSATTRHGITPIRTYPKHQVTDWHAEVFVCQQAPRNTPAATSRPATFTRWTSEKRMASQAMIKKVVCKTASEEPPRFISSRRASSQLALRIQAVARPS